MLIRHNFFFTVGTVIPMLEAAMSLIPIDKLAVHFHDTYGQSISNILVALQVNKFLQSVSNTSRYF